MSEISLRDYFAKLEDLLNASAADEVIHHCRHLLQFYPKNVAAYRFLGRALLINGRWDEATAALRRVLSVVPDDYHAHLGLSEVFEHRQKPDEAIWHLERAFEQNPNSRELLENLRSLYRRFRNLENARIQLTAAAVARQSRRNRSYEHAIDTLRDALERQPDRIDLQLLLAQTLWDSGNHVEAAETALDVLQTLPDCLEANRMLTALWLEEDRPSDAQRYLNRVEAIDPYLAVELAQGQPAPDDAFRLTEFDYVRSLQSELASDNPDWLQDITADTPQQSQPATDDWSNFMSSMLATSSPEQEQPAPAASADLFTEDWMELPTQAVPIPTRNDEDEIPEEFAAFPSRSEYDDLTALTPIPDFEAAPETPENAEADEALAWLQQTSPELIIQSQEENLPEISHKIPQITEADALTIEEPDSMAWLQEELLTEEARAPRPQPDAEAFAWMQNYDVEITEDNAPIIETDEQFPEEALSEDAESLRWLQDHEALDEVLGIEQLTHDQAESKAEANLEPADQLPPDLREMASMPEIPNLFDETPAEEDAWLADVSPTDAQAAPGPRRGLTAMLNEANFEWMKQQESQEDLMSDAVMDEWLAHFGAESKPDTVQEPDWLNELDTAMTDKNNLPNSSDADETPDWPSATGGEAEPESSAAEETPDWLSSEEPEAEAEPAEMPDWLAELQPEELASASTAETSDVEEASSAVEEFDWSASAAPEAEIAPAEMPDWLTQLEPTSTYEIPSGETSEPEPAAESGVEWAVSETVEAAEAEAEASDDAWFGEAAIEAEADAAEAEALAADETPEWLANLNLPSQPAAETEPQAAEQAESYTWYDELAIEAEALEQEEEPVAQSDVPEWLTELQLQEAEPESAAEASVTAAGEETWFGEAAIEAEAQPEAEQPAAVSSADMPEWLAELQAEEQAQSETEAELGMAAEVEDADWLNQVESEEFASEPEEPEPATEAHEWFAEVEQAEEPEQPAEVEPEPVVEVGDVEWLSELETGASETEDETFAAPEAEVEAAGLPYWLSEIEAVHSDQVEAIEPVTQPVTDQQEDYSWLDEVAPEAEPSAVEAVAQPIAADGEEYSWLDEISPDVVEPETESVEPLTEEPAAVTDTSEAPRWQEALEAEEYEAVEQPEEVEPELAPSLALAEEGIEEDEYWLNEEAQEPELVTGAQFATDAITESEEMESLPSEELMSEDEAYEPAPASNAPDWLNAMAPGLDVDYEAAEDESVETEFPNESAAEAEIEEREFAWVEDIIEEERRQPEPPRRRFIFSKAPAWLSRGSKSAKRDDELPDWPSDEPEWQR